MYKQPHVIHLKITALKPINKCPENYICLFIAFIFRKTFT